MPTSPAIAETCITPASHERFGAFSGDRNPIHADAAAARAMEPGGLLAYGMDNVLWAMESLTLAKRLPASLARIRARFKKWVFLEDCVALHPGRSTREGLLSFELLTNDTPVATLELFSGPCEVPREVPVRATVPVRLREARALALEEMEGCQGFAAVPAAVQAAALYPALAQEAGAATIAELAACSYVIGMEAPGLYSMSMRYDLSLLGARSVQESAGLHYQVVSVDTRFRTAKIEVAGACIAGTLEAFVRPA